MKLILVSVVAAVVLVGCGESQQSAPQAEAKPVVKAPDISLLDAAMRGQIGVVKLHLAAGTDVNVKDASDATPLHFAAGASSGTGHKEIAELLMNNGAEVNAKDEDGNTPLGWAISFDNPELVKVLRNYGAK